MDSLKLLGPEWIDQIIEMSLQIMKPYDGRNNSRHQKDWWVESYHKNGVLLGAFVDDQLVGYNFGFAYSPDEYHYSMGGILEQFRGRGLGKKMLQEQERLAKEAGYKEITVNTYKHMWPVQYQLLLKSGYTVYKEEENQWGEQTVIKSSFRKDI